MKAYSNPADLICDLHEKGFTNDFQLFGNDLLWVQEGIFVRAGEFTILEHYTIQAVGNKTENTTVFGILAPFHNIRGILLDHYKSYSKHIPPVLVRKLNEFNIQRRIEDDNILIV